MKTAYLMGLILVLGCSTAIAQLVHDDNPETNMSWVDPAPNEFEERLEFVVDLNAVWEDEAEEPPDNIITDDLHLLESVTIKQKEIGAECSVLCERSGKRMTCDDFLCTLMEIAERYQKSKSWSGLGELTITDEPAGTDLDEDKP